MPQPNSLAPEIISTSPFVAMFTAPNAGPKTLTGTHTFVVGRGPSYVIDPGPDIDTYQKALASWLAAKALSTSGILLSHGHPDHAPGARVLGEYLAVPVWAPREMDSDVAVDVGVERFYGQHQSFAVDATLLRVIPSPGHTHDHVAFWLEDDRILFSGDTILGEGTTLVAPPEGDMALYLDTLERFRALRPRLIVPGHGPLIEDPEAKINEYVEHRRQREEQVLDALKLGPATVPELVGRIYTDVDPSLHGLAAGSVEGQLAKLEREGMVRSTGGKFSLVGTAGEIGR